MLLKTYISPHENKKTLSPFYHKNYVSQKKNVKHSIGILHSFSIKTIFYDKIDLRLFNFRMMLSL